MKKVRRDILLITAATLLGVSSIAFSAENARIVDKFSCGKTKVEIVTEFGSEYCGQRTSQFITLRVGGKSVALDSIGNPLMAESPTKALALNDGWISSYLCISANSIRPRIIFNYENGGNCENCEWSSIHDGQGKRLAGGRTTKEKSQFKVAYEALRLKGGWSNQNFVSVSKAKCE